MKKLCKIKYLLLFAFLVVASYKTIGQSDSTKPQLSVTIHHFVVNNSFQYLLVETKAKVKGKWQPQKKQVVRLYLDSDSPECLIDKVMTDSEGKAKALIPVGLKSKWDASATHRFIAVTEAASREDETTTDAEITKAKISIDTSNLDDARTVNVQVTKLVDSSWQPVKDVDVKIGVRRLGGDLKIGDEETYTTDSLGQVSGEFKLDSLPGNTKGNLVLVAKVEDNDQLGSLSIDKIVPWGKLYNPVGVPDIGQRSLWAARGKAPIWLVIMAYSIIVAVWSVIIYLIFRIAMISKLGKKHVEATEAS